MSFGDHLMELRSRIIKALLGIVAAFGVGVLLAKPTILYISQPLIVSLKAAGFEPQMTNIAPAEQFMTFFRVAFYLALMISAPWVFHQLWAFIAEGMYAKEKRFVNVFAPFSAILFLTGAFFFINVVAPISFNFFVNFGKDWVVSDYADSFLYKRLFPHLYKEEEPAPVPAEGGVTLPENISVRWQFVPPFLFNSRLDIALDGKGAAPVREEPQKQRLIRPNYTLSEVVSMIVWLGLVFGLAFQIPLVVLTLGKIRLVNIKTLKSVRKYIIVAFVVLSAVITPPDVISQVALALPMYALYELGIAMLQYWPKK